MDDAVLARDAAREAIGDVEPDRLRELIDGRLAEATMTPGALTLLSTRAVDPEVDASGLSDRAAGVQLIYEGLRLTRRLAREEPWAAAPLDEDLPADVEILAADVLVARGFYLLARTDAADRAVETIRAFGRDQTERRAVDADREALDRNLEADVFALAVVAGTTAAGGDASERLLEYAADLARSHERGCPPAGALPEAAGDRIAALAGTDQVPPADP